MTRFLFVTLLVVLGIGATMMPIGFSESSVTNTFDGRPQPATAERGTTLTKALLAIATKLRSAQRIFKGRPVRTLSAKRVAVQNKVVQPLQRIRITSEFGFRIHPITKRKTFRNDTDFAAKLNDKVFSVENGTVARAGRRGALGNSVEVVTLASNLRTIFGLTFPPISGQ